MSNAFTSFLGGVVNGVFGTGPIVKDFQHADRVYVRNTYARSPKLGFLYFVSLEINPELLKQKQYEQFKNGYKEIGLLAKRVDLPKFSITNESLNQYNRKTYVQTAIKYNPVSIDFHDDNSNFTRDLWRNYFQYYVKDSNYKTADGSFPKAFTDNKFSDAIYDYGYNSNQTVPFLSAIHIYVLHQQRFTQYTLINPIITDWSHDFVGYDEGGKTLTNKMTVSYETVIYNEGKINQPNRAGGPQFTAIYYDKSPSPLSVAGNGSNTLLGAGGVIAGVDAVLGSKNILEAAIIGATTVRNARQLTKAGLKKEGYSILTGVLGEIQATGNQPNAVRSALSQRGIGVNISTGANSSVNNSTPTTPVELTKK